MNPRSIIATVIVALTAIASAAGQASEPPDVRLAVPLPFRTSVSVEHYRAGEDIVKSPPFRSVTTAGMTRYHGWFGPRVARQSDIHGWTVRVYATFSNKVAAVYASAKDGFQADLNEQTASLGDGTRPDLFARFHRKQFRWGRAVSFLSQGTQDGVLFGPVNGHLQYDVWGVTDDQKYTVVASVSVSHAKLPAWGDTEQPLRVARSIQALKRDPDYKLIERCKPEEFTPSLTTFDEMLDSLTIR